MQKGSSLQRERWQNAVFFLATVLIVAADQLSKIWIRSYPEEHTIFDARVFRIVNSHNTGAAFGIFQGQSLALTIVALVGVGILLFYALPIYRRFPLFDNMLSKAALGLVLGGTLGNLIDRLHLGFVTDFIDFGFWPAFNIADSAITVGVILFAYFALRSLSRGARHEGG